MLSSMAQYLFLSIPVSTNIFKKVSQRTRINIYNEMGRDIALNAEEKSMILKFNRH